MYNVSFPDLGINNLPINKVAFTIGDREIYWYGVIIAAGLVLAVIYAMTVCKKRFGIDPDKLLNCTIVGLITAIIGARLYYVAFEWETYSKDPMKIFSINEGGLAIYGGLIGALIGGLIVAKICRLNIPAVLDVAVLGFLIGQGIGRWGNFMNQEAFGTPTDLPWGMVSENTGGVAVHPCFLYESLWCLLGFVLLHFFSKYFRKYDGQIFLMYLVWYGVERMVVEGLRTDSLMTPIFNLRVSQVLSAALVIVGLVFLIINFVHKKDTIAVPVNRLERKKA
ncbi:MULTISPECIES: prolipoprotein diacylglyceryl transferase [unclassified Ruminococcus]|uniref:prolipoprotein diacylglyceryl transferase n=1 Tax=unclassified Ruminococcus TaxID=2608920 RepID=UPI00210E8C6B|nr:MULTISPECIES: prolipoprotein diacylglyceryl transferase [unclassified Ruminococcus]MCQ4021495.1 prolipoprotein diacylglyceryl transferase [Ruminococcus sp. zg-924]MCQ4113940.1 prolipoprotein diacylglyceryl transferase [Ruminococcus sp. zg-921]